MKFGVGVIGATGYIGTPYRAEIRESLDDATIVALCARRRDRLETAAQDDGGALIADDWREVVEHPGVDLVLILTPDALHHESAMACAAAGKHVVCEKPVGMNAREAREIWEAFRDASLCHFVPFWTRYGDIFQRAREIVDTGVLGAIRAAVYRWQNPRPATMPFTWRDDAMLSAGGSIADVGSHAYDTMRWLLGTEAKRVLTYASVLTDAKPDLGPIDLSEAIAWGEAHDSAQSETRRKATAYDFADIAIEFESGIVGSLVLSHAPVFRKGLAPELELHGEDASLGIDRFGGTITLVRTGGDIETIASVPDVGFGNRFAKHVFPALREQLAGAPREGSPHPNLHDGWRVQVFTDAAALSAERGAWVKIEEIERNSVG
jgi:predicted dehydrogenase